MLAPISSYSYTIWIMHHNTHHYPNTTITVPTWQLRHALTLQIYPNTIITVPMWQLRCALTLQSIRPFFILVWHVICDFCKEDFIGTESSHGPQLALSLAILKVFKRVDSRFNKTEYRYAIAIIFFFHNSTLFKKSCSSFSSMNFSVISWQKKSNFYILSYSCPNSSW